MLYGAIHIDTATFKVKLELKFLLRFSFISWFVLTCVLN